MRAAFTNWRSTILGLLAGLAVIAPSLIDYVQNHPLPTDSPMWITFLKALLIAALGWVAKDAKVSGLPSNPRTE